MEVVPLKLIIFNQDKSGQPTRSEEDVTSDMAEEPSETFWKSVEEARGPEFARNFRRSKRTEQYKEWLTPDE